jgi:hypothetical protein
LPRGQRRRSPRQFIRPAIQNAGGWLRLVPSKHRTETPPSRYAPQIHGQPIIGIGYGILDSHFHVSILLSDQHDDSIWL